MNQIRRELRSSLTAISESASVAENVRAELVDFIKLRNPRTLGIYSPMERWKEISLLFLEEHFSEKCAFPKTSANGQMSFRLCHSSKLKSNAQIAGLQEPLDDHVETIPDIVFAPATACDKQGHRIGKGGGFYDKYFAQHPECLAIGVVDERCLHSHFDPSWVKAHDHRMAFVLTQFQLFQTKETTT